MCGDDPLADRDPLRARLLSSAVAGAPPAGPARKVAPIVLLAPSGGGVEPRRTGRLTAELGGFSLHAATHVQAHDARGREAICRCILRPPLANDRLTALPGARVRITLKKAFRDGTTAVELGALAFMSRLAELVPAPRLHLVRYHGLLAPRSRHRRQIIPPPPGGTPAGAPPPGGTEEVAPADAAPRFASSAEGAQEDGPATGAPPPPRRRCYTPWAELLRRTWSIDVLACDRCQGRMKLVSIVKDPASARAFLAGVGMPTGPPDSAPAPRSVAPPHDAALDPA